MLYILLPILVISAVSYMKIAKKQGIVDQPNERSSHSVPTIRGGGIIFLIAALLFFLFYDFQYPFFISGLVLVGIISFLDDLYSLGSLPRLLIQCTAILLTSYEIGLFDYHLMWIVIGVVFSIGFLNIYNFMDGINGITGLYSISVLLPLVYVNNYLEGFINPNLLVLTLFSLLIFGYYNYRKAARAFAGDIGSIVIGLLLIFCLGKLIIQSNNFIYLSFFLLYLLDGGYTILERFFIHKENIMRPHRRHLYQLLVDHSNYQHMKVASLYAGIQMLISFSAIAINGLIPGIVVFSLLFVATSIAYLIIKFRIIKRFELRT